MVKIGPKLGLKLKCPFPPFLRIIFGVFVETSLKTVHTFLMGHILKFPAKKSFFCRAGSQRGPEENSPKQVKIAFLSRFTPICWDIFHKLPLNNMLLAIRVPLKHFFKKLLWLGGVMGPKMAQNALFPYFSELFLVLLLKHSSKHYSFTIGHGLKEEMEMEIARPKTKTPGNSIAYCFFVVTLGNSTTFLINPWKFYMLFL